LKLHNETIVIYMLLLKISWRSFGNSRAQNPLKRRPRHRIR